MGLILFVFLTLQAQVVHVIDGDTIIVKYNGKSETIRLLCVDTPESVHPDKRRNTPMGIVASNYTKKRLLGKHVILELLPFNGRRGRHLAYVFVDGQNFNVELVNQGLSPYYTKYGISKYDTEFRKAETK